MLIRKRYPLFDENNGGQGSAGGGGQGSQGGQGGQGGQQHQEPAHFSVEYVRELRHENAGYRLKAQEATQKAQAAEEATKKAQEAADKAKADAETAANARIIKAEMKALAVKAGIVDIDGLALADLSNVKFDDTGELQGAQEALDALKKAKPYLFTTTTSNPGHQGQQGQQGAKGDTGKKNAMTMSDDEWKAQKKALGLR